MEDMWGKIWERGVYVKKAWKVFKWETKNSLKHEKKITNVVICVLQQWDKKNI